jgi:cysteine desulfurase
MNPFAAIRSEIPIVAAPCQSNSPGMTMDCLLPGTKDMHNIYLDNNATTPIDPRVAAVFTECLCDGYMNAASQHSAGQRASLVLEDARDVIRRQLGADNIVLTSGATEANNLALRGLAGQPGDHLLVSRIEHPSVTETASQLHQQGVDVEWVPVSQQGTVDLSYIADHIRDDTSLVVLMAANHETGIRQPVKEVVEICQGHDVPVHCDAAQLVGKAVANFTELGVSSMSVAAHKFHGPRGVGALLYCDQAVPRPLFAGGPQQQGLRPGTEPVCLAVAMARAVQIAVEELADNQARMQEMLDAFEQQVQHHLPEAIVVGAEQARLAHTSCITFPSYNRQAIVMALDLAGIACSTGSACASGSSDPSPVLAEMQLEQTHIEGAVRFSFSRLNKLSDATAAGTRISSVISGLGCHKEG